MRSWIYLFAAIGFEVVGTTSMKLTTTLAPFYGHLLMYAMVGLSYYFLSLAIKRVPVGVAYALWERIGIVLITLVSVACTSAVLVPGKIRQFTLARARCGSALVAWPASSIVATQLVWRTELWFGSRSTIARAASSSGFLSSASSAAFSSGGLTAAMRVK